VEIPSDVTVKLNAPPTRYQLCELSFRYKDDKPCLKALDLSLHKGETIAIIGPTGGGKSTLLNILCGLETRYEGDFWVDEMWFGGRHFEGMAEDLASQQKYGIQVPEPEVDEALQSDADCQAKAEAICDFLKDSVITLQNVVKDGDHRYIPANRQRVVVSSANLDDYFRIVQVEDKVVGVAWDSILALSDEPQFVEPAYVGPSPVGGLVSVFREIKRQRVLVARMPS